MSKLPGLVKLLCDLRLAALALAIVIEAITTRSAAVTLVLLCAMPASYVPLRRWESVEPWLRRAPLLMVLDVAYATVLLLLASSAELMLLYCLATVILATLVFDGLGAVLAGGLLCTSCLAAALVSLADGSGSTRGAITLFGYVALYLLAAAGSLRFRSLLLDLDRAHAQATTDSRRAAHAEERVRLSREMHDSVSKTLHGIRLLTMSLDKRLDAGDVRAAGQLAGQLASASESAAADARRLMHDLRADQPDESLESVFARCISEWGEQSDTKVVEITTRTDAELGVTARYEAMCVVREALANVDRHARASTVSATLTEADGWVHFRIADDGVGFTPPANRRTLGTAGHYGVIGMYERAARVGGSLEVTPREGGGTTVELAVPAALTAAQVEADLQVAT